MSNLSSKFEVRKATETEISTILQEPQLLARLGLKDITKLKGFKHLPHIIEFKNYRLLFTFWEVAVKDVYEVHIACPKNSIIASRALSLGILDWMFSPSSELEAKAIVTSCPEGKIANMCRKIGFREIKKKSNKVYFIITLFDTAA